MRSSISAQSCDSVPPAPGWMVTMALRASFSPESSVLVSSSSTLRAQLRDLARQTRLPPSRLRAPARSKRRCRSCGAPVRLRWPALLPGACAAASPAAIARDSPRSWGRRFSFPVRLAARGRRARQRYSRRSWTFSLMGAYSRSNSSTTVIFLVLPRRHGDTENLRSFLLRASVSRWRILYCPEACAESFGSCCALHQNASKEIIAQPQANQSPWRV